MEPLALDEARLSALLPVCRGTDQAEVERRKEAVASSILLGAAEVLPRVS